MILDTQAIWDAILRYVYPILTLIALLWSLIIWRKMKPLFAFGMRLMKSWGTMMQEKREQKDRVVKLTEDQKRARSKLAKSIKAKIPLGLLDRHNDDEVIAMIQDQELMKGMIVLGETGAGAIKWIMDKIAPTKKEKKQLGLLEAPEMK